MDQHPLQSQSQQSHLGCWSSFILLKNESPEVHLFHLLKYFKCAAGSGECLNIHGKRPSIPDLTFNLPHTCIPLHTDTGNCRAVVESTGFSSLLCSLFPIKIKYMKEGRCDG